MIRDPLGWSLEYGKTKLTLHHSNRWRYLVLSTLDAGTLPVIQPRLKPCFQVVITHEEQKTSHKTVASNKIDKLALDHFEDPNDFARGIKLLYESVAALTQGQSFKDYEENFLMDLDELDQWLLSKAERFNQKIQSEFGKLQQEITVLREALRNSKSVTSPEDQEALITKIRESIHPPLSDEENPTLKELFEKWKEANKGRMVETSYENSYKPAMSYSFVL